MTELLGLPERDVSTNRIYAYKFHLSELSGRIKVGQTARTVKGRVAEQIKTAGLSDLVEILLNEPAIDIHGNAFRDTEVHKALQNLPGVNRLATGGGSEWFECSLDDVVIAYQSVVKGSVVQAGRTQSYQLRDEQKAAIAKTQMYFDTIRSRDPKEAPRFLWNAKMRFGKTFTAYKLAQGMGAKRVLVATFKPAVADAWETDLMSHVDFGGWTFLQAGVQPDQDRNEPFVYFASFQDLLGVDPTTGTFKAKNSWIEDEPWDLVVLDEYHYGAWRYADAELLAGEAGGGKIDLLAQYTPEVNLFEEEQDEWGRSEQEFLPFRNAKAYLYLSGTPFRALASGQFKPEQIYNWTYVDEQAAKRSWTPTPDTANNPYLSLPSLHLLTYELPESMRTVAAKGARNEFDLNAFFKATGEGRDAVFEMNDFVLAWLDWLHGQGDMAIEVALQAMAKPMPFADFRLRQYLDHSVWYLPSVAAVHAMRNLLTAKGSRWAAYDVVSVAGESAGVGREALPPVRKAIGTGYDTRTITLTCGKLLTGVTVPQWAAILMLCNLTSPETYFQAAFRVQSAWTVKNPNGDDPNYERVEKPASLVIDFAPSRALRLYGDYAVRLGTGSDPQSDLNDLSRYLPILAFDGASMRSVGADEVLDVALESASVDTRKMDSARFINPRLGIAARLDDGAKEALGRIRLGVKKTTRSQSSPPPTVLTSDPHVQPTGSGASTEDANERSTQHEELDALAQRLQFLARRLNAFMYLSSTLETSLRDVLSTDETELFEQVMRLSPSEMTSLVDAGLFNEAALRLSILQFARADRESLTYTGVDPWKLLDSEDRLLDE